MADLWVCSAARFCSSTMGSKGVTLLFCVFVCSFFHCSLCLYVFLCFVCACAYHFCCLHLSSCANYMVCAVSCLSLFVDESCYYQFCCSNCFLNHWLEITITSIEVDAESLVNPSDFMIQVQSSVATSFCKIVAELLVCWFVRYLLYNSWSQLLLCLLVHQTCCCDCCCRKKRMMCQ